MSGIIRETMTLIIMIVNMGDYNNGLQQQSHWIGAKFLAHASKNGIYIVPCVEPANEIEWVKRENPNMMQLKIILWLTHQKTSSLYQIYNQDVGIE